MFDDQFSSLILAPRFYQEPLCCVGTTSRCESKIPKTQRHKLYLELGDQRGLTLIIQDDPIALSGINLGIRLCGASTVLLIHVLAIPCNVSLESESQVHIEYQIAMLWQPHDWGLHAYLAATEPFEQPGTYLIIFGISRTLGAKNYTTQWMAWCPISSIKARLAIWGHVMVVVFRRAYSSQERDCWIVTDNLLWDMVVKLNNCWNWLVVWNIFPCIGNNHPNWLIFFRGVETTIIAETCLPKPT